MDKKENPVLLTTIQSYLHQHGYKMTPQREEIIRVLLHTRDHLSVEDIYSILKRQNLNIGLATVYRTMDILYDIKVVDKVSFGDHIVRYEWRKESLNRAHHHLFCTECGKIIELDDDLLSMLDRVIRDKYEFYLEDHPLSLYGVCADCKHKKEEK